MTDGRSPHFDIVSCAITPHYSARSFQAAGHDSDEARELADELEKAVHQILFAQAKVRLDDVVERLNSMGHRLVRKDADWDEVSYRQDPVDTQSPRSSPGLRLEYSLRVMAGYAHLYTDEELDEFLDELADGGSAGEDRDQTTPSEPLFIRWLNGKPNIAGYRSDAEGVVDGRFPAAAFEKAGWGTSEVRARADQLERVISLEIFEVVAQLMDGIVRRLNMLGHDLRPEQEAEPGDVSYRDDRLVEDDYICKLRVSVSDLVTANFDSPGHE